MIAAPGHTDQWAQRLKREFDIDIKTYSECGGAVKVIARIEDPEVIAKIMRTWKGSAGNSVPPSRVACDSTARIYLQKVSDTH